MEDHHQIIDALRVIATETTGTLAIPFRRSLTRNIAVLRDLRDRGLTWQKIAQLGEEAGVKQPAAMWQRTFLSIEGKQTPPQS